jgi:hypothetical protein
MTTRSTDEVIEDANRTIAIHDGVLALKAENARLRAALTEISKGEGAFSRDRLTHATNTIDSMKQIALGALAK